MFDFLSEKFGGVLDWLKNKGHLSENDLTQALGKIHEALCDADVPLGITNDFLESVKIELHKAPLVKSLTPGQQVIKVIHTKMLHFLGNESSATETTFLIPSVVLVMGLQGSGKTTTIAKLAYKTIQDAAKKGKTRRILLASVDFYRPAAIEQLQILAERTGTSFYAASTQEPRAATQEIIKYMKVNRYEILFLDTAGRLHVDAALLEELAIVDRIAQAKHKFLVLDAMTGQESLRVAQTFNNAVGFDAAILTKMDGSCRGGAAFSFRYAIKKPIAFVGTGEKPEDLEAFFPERIATRILGMGDVLSLIEKANNAIEQNAQEDLGKKFMSGNFTLEDFAVQMQTINKMGPLNKLVQYLPGMGSISPDAIKKGQAEFKVFSAIISSMTRKEKLSPQILDDSRKQRIAQGSGTKVQNVNQLLEKFEQSKQFAKMIKKMGGFKNFFKS